MNMRILDSERGVATLIAMLMMGMLLLIGLAALTTSDDEVTIAGNEMQEMKAFYAAEAGLEKATSILQSQYDSTGLPPTVMPRGTEEINGCVVSYAVIDDGPVVQKPLSQGALAGLNARVKSFKTNSIGISPIDHSKVIMSQSFETALVPVFQFAVFYGNDLEIAPGPDMTLIGRVHSNGDLYIQSSSSLSMDSYVTASGNISHGRKGAGGVATGDVLIKNAVGDYVSMKDGGDWLDANDAYWCDSSAARWGGRVQDAAHGQQALQLPLTDTDNPHALVERGDGNADSYEHLATLIIKDGVVSRKLVDGSWQDVTAAMVADGTLSYSTNKFYDQRESNYVDVTDLDIGLMYDNGYAPTNGVIYFADDLGPAEWPALRINNGAELDAGLTIASENPMYTVGDFNSTNKKPASLMADAVTFLSDAWVDSKGANPKGDRIANATTVNASYLTGNVETTDADYNGGFENLPRFLEVWTGKGFTWSGSAVNLWNSEQANANWSGAYYSPPIRNWSYDTNLDDPNQHPPETPTVRVFQRTGWKQEFVGFATSGTD